jgi:hypothetical protein
MPYDVEGWVETTWVMVEVRADAAERELSYWNATQWLDGLGLPSGVVSDLPFGLAKRNS